MSKARIGIVKDEPKGSELRWQITDFEKGHELVDVPHPEDEFPYTIVVYGGGVYFKSTTRFQTEEAAKEAAGKFIQSVQKTLEELEEPA